jgi:hypothetical protein
MAVTRVRIASGSDTVKAYKLPNVCMHCGLPAEKPAERRGIPATPTRKVSGLEKQAAAIAGALLAGPMGYAAATGAYQTKPAVWVEIPVCGGCRRIAGKGISVLRAHGKTVVLEGVAEGFAAAAERMLNAELEESEQQVRQPGATESQTPRRGADEGGFDWSNLNG